MCAVVIELYYYMYIIVDYSYYGIYMCGENKKEKSEKKHTMYEREGVGRGGGGGEEEREGRGKGEREIDPIHVATW